MRLTLDQWHKLRTGNRERRPNVESRQAPVEAAWVTNMPDWDRFLSYVQWQLDREKDAVEARRSVYQEALPGTRDALTAWRELAEAQSRVQILSWVMELPKSIAEIEEETLKELQSD